MTGRIFAYRPSPWVFDRLFFPGSDPSTAMGLMGTASFLIGCLPTYEMIGRAAPLLLLGVELE